MLRANVYRVSCFFWEPDGDSLSPALDLSSVSVVIDFSSTKSGKKRYDIPN